jgi:hypothetical protein
MSPPRSLIGSMHTGLDGWMMFVAKWVTGTVKSAVLTTSRTEMRVSSADLLFLLQQLRIIPQEPVQEIGLVHIV